MPAEGEPSSPALHTAPSQTDKEGREYTNHAGCISNKRRVYMYIHNAMEPLPAMLLKSPSEVLYPQETCTLLYSAHHYWQQHVTSFCCLISSPVML